MGEVKRKGARSIKDIPHEILEQLNKGETETVNLVEWLAVDQIRLLENLLKQHDRMDYFLPIQSSVEQLNKQTVTTVNEAIGVGIFEQIRLHNDPDFFTSIPSHKADLVRCWATYSIGKNPELDIGEALSQIRLFAADTHFGVREISWMAVRERITTELEKSIAILTTWTSAEDENLRRFATESTRPRGVWCKHIEKLKTTPELALPLLEPLLADSSKYVRDSVGNWLNDASKTRPDFVIQLCRKWEKENNSTATAYILKKALRTILK